MADSGMTMSGKRIVVIGGSSGIGFAVAELAKQAGANIIIGSSSGENLDRAVARLPGAVGRMVDLGDERSVEAFFMEVGVFDHLVITAGDRSGPMFLPLADLDLQSARQLFDVRFWGALAAAKYAAKTIAHGGSITLTGGMLAHRPTKGAPMASAVGGAVEYLTRGLAMDLAPIRINAVSPGVILTQLVSGWPDEAIQAFVGHLPIARAATPHEAAMAYFYLMQNSYITGQVLPVDGGGHIV